MSTLTASNARIPSQVFNRVVYQDERVRIDRRGGDAVYLINEYDLKRLEDLDEVEDRLDVEEARKAKAEPGGITLEELEAKIEGEGR